VDHHETLFFMHIPKTGGTSINSYITKNCSPNNCLTNFENKEKINICKLVNFKYISGHSPYHYANKILNFDSNWYLFSVIRDPFDQLISHLSWTRNLRKNPRRFNNTPSVIQDLSNKLNTINFNNPLSIKSLLDTMPGIGIALFDNRQTRYFSNVSDSERVVYENLNEANRVIKEFNHIGIYEDLSRSFDCIKNFFRFKEPTSNYYPHLNTINPKILKEVYDKEFYEVFYPYIQYDIKIYKTVVEKIKEA
jgi:hypothetical protein